MYIKRFLTFVRMYYLCVDVSQPSHTRHNTSPKYKENKQGKNAIIYRQANKTRTSVQDQEELQRNTSVEELHTTATTR
jgi:hypothetical protein